MFTKDELNTIAVLLKSGIKTMDVTGNNLIIVGALMKKLEDLMSKQAVGVPPQGTGNPPAVKKEEATPKVKK